MNIKLYIQLGVTSSDEYKDAFLRLCRKCDIIPAYRYFSSEDDLMIHLREEATNNNIENCIVIESSLNLDPETIPENHIKASGNTRLREKDLISKSIKKILKKRMRETQEILKKLEE